MNALRRVDARLKGLRIYLIAFVFALPDILNGLAGVDFTTVFPARWGAGIGILLTVLRLSVPPLVEQAKRSRGGE